MVYVNGLPATRLGDICNWPEVPDAGPFFQGNPKIRINGMPPAGAIHAAKGAAGTIGTPLKVSPNVLMGEDTISLKIKVNVEAPASSSSATGSGSTAQSGSASSSGQSSSAGETKPSPVADGPAGSDSSPPEGGMCTQPETPTDAEGGMCTQTYPDRPEYEPGKWNDPGIQNSNNCYSYAANDPYGHPDDTKPQPGYSAGAPAASAGCGDILDGAAADGMPPMCIDPSNPPPGTYPVALVHGHDATGDEDYHWYRQDDDGSWSHKPGHDPATNRDASGNPIHDPQSADRNGIPHGGYNYDEFCGYFPMPADGLNTSSEPGEPDS